MDLIAYGRVYRHVHQRKDAASQRVPGLRHRMIGHEWYREWGRRWDFADPFPEACQEGIRRLREKAGPDVTEEQMASDAHDYFDGVWDDLPEPIRDYARGFFAWLLYHPDLLESWAGVDVIGGRILRKVNGQEYWEDSPETVREYKRVRREVSRHQKSRLREILMRYGG